MASKEKGWVVDITKQLDNVDASVELIQWGKHSIYKVPTCIKNLNPSAYLPQIVIFGPYHYGEDHLMPMEMHKQRALLHFLKRSRKPFEDFVCSMQEVVQELQDSYESLDEKWKAETDEFLELMIVDGCFLIEVLTISTGGRLSDYAVNDPISSSHGILYAVPYI